MAVTVHWAEDNAGSDIVQPLAHTKSGGGVSNGETTDAETVYIYHDGTNDITDCAFYIAEYSGSYNGGASAAADLSELLAWGNGATANSFGGYQINMDASNSFAQAWPTESSHQQGTPALAFVFNTTDSLGNNASNAIDLHANMLGGGGGSTGVCPANSPNGYGLDYKFQCRIEVPTDEDTAGKRQFDLVLKYTYTS